MGEFAYPPPRASRKKNLQQKQAGCWIGESLPLLAGIMYSPLYYRSQATIARRLASKASNEALSEFLTQTAEGLRGDSAGAGERVWGG